MNPPLTQWDQELISLQLPDWSDLQDKQAGEDLRKEILQLTTREGIDQTVQEGIMLVKNLLMGNIINKQVEKSTAMKEYDQNNLGITRDWLTYSMSHYNLQAAVKDLIRVRTFSLPSVHDILAAHDRKKEKTKLKKGRCPLCEGKVEFKWEWAHLIFDCDSEAVVKARRTHLAQAILTLRKELSKSPHFGVVDEINPFRTYGRPTYEYRKIIPVYLIGGSYNGYLTNWTMGFGHLKSTAAGFKQPGWTLMAQFFHEVSPIYLSALYENPVPAITQSTQCRNGDSPIENFEQLFNTPETPDQQAALFSEPDTPDSILIQRIDWEQDHANRLAIRKAKYKTMRKVLVIDTDSELESEDE